MSSYVYIGYDQANPDIVITEEHVIDINSVTSADLILNELSADSAELTVDYVDTYNKLRDLGWAVPVCIYNDNGLSEKFYSTGVTRTGKNQYKITATSLIGLLEYDTYYGGIFSGDTFQSVIENIITTNGITPYYGVYRKIRRTNTETSNTSYAPYNLNVGLSIYGDAGVRADVTINKSLLNDVSVPELANATSARDVIWGTACEQGVTASAATRMQFGLLMNLSRNSTSDPWPDFGPVYFVYGSNIVSLGTPTQATRYNIHCRGTSTKTATINGTDYTFSDADKKPNQTKAWLQYAFGGRKITDSSLSTAAGSLPHDVTYSNYRVYDSSTHNYLVDAVAYKDRNGNLTAGSATTGWTYSSRIRNVTPVESSYLAFQSAASYQDEILNSIEYGTGIASLPIYGWLPVGTKREAMHQLLFSQGVMLWQTSSGVIKLTRPSTASYTEISTANIYDEGSEEYAEQTNLVTVTEHEYVYDNTAELEVVYEGESALEKDGVIVEFSSAPIYYTHDNVTIGTEVIGVENVIFYAGNCNAAIVGKLANTSYSGAIRGRKYVHNEKIVSRAIGNYPDGKEISVSDVTLITSNNSAAVADRMVAYSEAYTVKNSILIGTEHNGGYYKFVSPFRNNVYGFLKSITRNVSSIVKADCEFIVNYTPP